MKKNRKQQRELEKLSEQHMNLTIDMAEYAKLMAEMMTKIRVTRRKLLILEARMELLEGSGGAVN